MLRSCHPERSRAFLLFRREAAARGAVEGSLFLSGLARGPRANWQSEESQKRRQDAGATTGERPNPWRCRAPPLGLLIPSKSEIQMVRLPAFFGELPDVFK